jgi:hypothetical protein
MLPPEASLAAIPCEFYAPSIMRRPQFVDHNPDKELVQDLPPFLLQNQMNFQLCLHSHLSLGTLPMTGQHPFPWQARQSPRRASAFQQ